MGLAKAKQYVFDPFVDALEVIFRECAYFVTDLNSYVQ
jgi:hypothetical protein